MKGVAGLSNAIKEAVQKKVNEEARAMRGKIVDGQFQCGSKSYPVVRAVDCNTSEGSRVWAQLSQNGSAVIVGS